MKYVLYRCQAGFSDMLGQLQRCLMYCKHYRRVLLIDCIHSLYTFNFDDYFNIVHAYNVRIISDIAEINQIIQNNRLRVYPKHLRGKLLDYKPIYSSKYKNFVDNIKGYKITFNFREGYFEDILVSDQCGWSHSDLLFKTLQPTNILLDDFKHKYELLKKPYLAIHIRNTDYTCDYKQLYKDNIAIIKSFNCIYLATDDKQCIIYFKSLHANIFNFTTFPDQSYESLHTSDVDNVTKFKDMFSDLLLLGCADKIISTSKGGYIKLARSLNNNALTSGLNMKLNY